jgi:hypothetical protein
MAGAAPMAAAVEPAELKGIGPQGALGVAAYGVDLLLEGLCVAGRGLATGHAVLVAVAAAVRRAAPERGTGGCRRGEEGVAGCQGGEGEGTHRSVSGSMTC